MVPRYLTKSRFKLALECETKLFYTKKEDKYADQNFENSFMKSLAEGGFQVGELAKYYFCDDPIADGVTIETIKDDEALVTANAKLQFGHVPLEQREMLRDALLKYCELDKLAMVMITEFWMDKMNKAIQQR